MYMYPHCMSCVRQCNLAPRVYMHYTCTFATSSTRTFPLTDSANELACVIEVPRSVALVLRDRSVGLGRERGREGRERGREGRERGREGGREGGRVRECFVTLTIPVHCTYSMCWKDAILISNCVWCSINTSSSFTTIFCKDIVALINTHHILQQTGQRGNGCSHTSALSNWWRACWAWATVVTASTAAAIRHTHLVPVRTTDQKWNSLYSQKNWRNVTSAGMLFRIHIKGDAKLSLVTTSN